MEFEEMQIIWNRQNGEKLYAINETALYAQIKRRGQSISRKVALVEWIMIAVNLIVAIVLLVDVVRDNGQAHEFVMPALYLAYSVFALIRRQLRRKEIVQFDRTMLGELDKAIWQIDYLIRQGRSMILWYLLPLMGVFSVIAFFNDRLLWALGLLVIVLPAAYFGGRWEINKFYLPKKRDLESLRDKLITSKP